jgi:thioesterase domain-containing protein/acyl carrier protein
MVQIRVDAGDPAGHSEKNFERPADPINRDDMYLSVPYVAPGCETETTLAEIWSSVLEIRPIGIDDDFFELGGDSFAATVVASQIEASLKVPFSPADIIQSSTIRDQARHISQHGATDSAELPSFVVACNVEGPKPPFFLVHGAAGFMFLSPEFLKAIGEDQPVYMIQAPGMDGRDKPCRSVEEFAETYIKVVRRIVPEGPYRIGATCTGSFICLEMCKQLNAAGIEVDKLILVDPPMRIAEGRFPKPQGLSGLRQYQRLVKHWFRMKARSLTSRIEITQHVVMERARAARLKNRLKKIERRQSGVATGIRQEELSYEVDSMLDVSLKLHHAFKTYKTEYYDGHAYMLVTKNRIFNTTADSLYSNKIKSISSQVIPISHKSIFNENITEMAGFIRRSLQS